MSSSVALKSSFPGRFPRTISWSISSSGKSPRVSADADTVVAVTVVTVVAGTVDSVDAVPEKTYMETIMFV